MATAVIDSHWQGVTGTGLVTSSEIAPWASSQFYGPAQTAGRAFQAIAPIAGMGNNANYNIRVIVAPGDEGSAGSSPRAEVYTGSNSNGTETDGQESYGSMAIMKPSSSNFTSWCVFQQYHGAVTGSSPGFAIEGSQNRLLIVKRGGTSANANTVYTTLQSNMTRNVPHQFVWRYRPGQNGLLQVWWRMYPATQWNLVYDFSGPVGYTIGGSLVKPYPKMGLYQDSTNPTNEIIHGSGRRGQPSFDQAAAIFDVGTGGGGSGGGTGGGTTTPPAYITNILGQSQAGPGFTAASIDAKRASLFPLPSGGGSKILGAPKARLDGNGGSSGTASVKVVAYEVSTTTADQPTTKIAETTAVTINSGDAAADVSFSWSGTFPSLTADGRFIALGLHTSDPAGVIRYNYWDNHPTRSLRFQSAGADLFTDGTETNWSTASGGTQPGRELVVWAPIQAAPSGGGTKNLPVTVSGATQLAFRMDTTTLDQSLVWQELEVDERPRTYGVAWYHDPDGNKLFRVRFDTNTGLWVRD